MAVGVLLHVAASARCGRAVALWALLMCIWVDLDASAPTNCPPEVAGSLGEAALAILAFFSAVEFGKAACAAIVETELSLRTAQACWEAADTSKVFIDLVGECCPKLPVAVRVQMAAVFKKAASERSVRSPGARASSGSLGFGAALASELAVGLEEATREGKKMDDGKLKEVSEKATASAVERFQSAEAIQDALFHATMYPVAVLAVAKDDPVMYDKLRSKLIKEGSGEYSRHLSSLATFDEWLATLYRWLNSQGHMDAVAVLQKWRLSIALDWAMGGKAYVQLYFRHYHGTFPVECDSQLMFRAQSVGMEKFMKKLEKFNNKTAANAAALSDSD